MQSVDDVVKLDGNLRVGIDAKVERLDVGRGEEEGVEEKVGEVAEKVEGDEVEVEAHHALSSPVRPDLRIERQRPAEEVDPAGDNAQHGHNWDGTGINDVVERFVRWNAAGILANNRRCVVHFEVFKAVISF